ncbi:bis(5'-nucleosyl)-tetraphosphatase (symmetrical) YqeK [Ruminococcaceae bacterium OttesenSCG-928-I18]|nr:bis(5'-nucleosyl)-tetraphosphatase (symmetrical) YqeK [Ruminococcaceae bacterium OttesenSCG-928-I18]
MSKPTGGDATVVTLEEAQELVREKLSEKRYKHVKNVVEAARKLAVHYEVDVQKAQLAGWLHDIVKESSREELLQLLRRDAIMAGATEQRPLPVWHGPCAAIYAKQELGVQDGEILSAIACHTTGKSDMSLFDKVIFLADIISAERSFPGVGKLRKLAFEDLDEAVIAAMEENIIHLNKLHKPLDTDTVQALESLRAQRPTRRKATMEAKRP